jgi:DNA-binding transcriptional regulator YiaG
MTKGDEGVSVVSTLDVKGICAKVGMSEVQFAEAFCLKRRTLQQWEQGTASPDLFAER